MNFNTTEYAKEFLTENNITPERLSKVSKLNEIAKMRGQSLSQMAIAWLLSVGNTTSVLVGASSSKQIIENVNALSNTTFSDDEIKMIEDILIK